MAPDTRRGRLSTGLAAAGALLVLAGLAAWMVQDPVGRGGGSPAAGAEHRSAAGPTSTTARPVRAAWEPGAPRRVVIPALGVDAAVVPVGAPGGTLVPPSDPRRLGWWADGARPGAASGSTLVAGHTVHTGGGALDDLERLTPGARVVVRTAEGRIVYEVDRVRVYDRGRIARHADRLFSQEVPGRLVLVTCADWDGTRYLSNVVVTAVPVSG